MMLFKKISLLLFIVALGGCALSGLATGGSSMDVEVEVYQGPLTKTPETQWAELIGIVQMGSCKSTYSHNLKNVLNKLQSSKTYRKIPGTDKKIIEESISTLETSSISMNKEFIKLFYLGQKDESTKILLKTLLVYITECATEVMTAAYHETLWSKEKVCTMETNHNFNNCEAQTQTRKNRRCDNMTREQCAIYARMLQSRSELLLRQLDGEYRGFLPLSAYLTEASPSLFTELCYGSSNCENDRGKFYIDFEKPNVADALLNQYYWQRINRVHSSGLGNVSTAFIKDDIGNWSLKSFDSNPEELLNAYQNFGLKAIATAGRLASGSITGTDLTDINDSFTTSKKYLALSENIAFGESATVDNTKTITQIQNLRSDTIAAIETARVKFSADLAAQNLILKGIMDNIESIDIDKKLSDLETYCHTRGDDALRLDLNLDNCGNPGKIRSSDLAYIKAQKVAKRKEIQDEMFEPGDDEQRKKEAKNHHEILDELIKKLEDVLQSNIKLETSEEKRDSIKADILGLKSGLRDDIRKELTRYKSTLLGISSN